MKNERISMANAILQTKIDKMAKADAEFFSNSALAAIEEAKSLARNPRVKRYSSAKELLEDCK